MHAASLYVYRCDMYAFACLQVCGNEQSNAPLVPQPFTIAFSGGWIGPGYVDDGTDVFTQPALVMSGQQTPTVVMPTRTPYNPARDPCTSSVTVSEAAVVAARAAYRVVLGGYQGGVPNVGRTLGNEATDCREPEAKPHQRTPIPGGAQCVGQNSFGAEPTHLLGVLQRLRSLPAPGVPMYSMTKS
jgi:hypothetical protein